VTILTNTLGRPWVPNHMSHEMRTALDRLGFPPKLNVHGLRKLFAANLADAGATVHEIAAGTGHKTLSMVQFYTESANQRALAGKAIGRLATFYKRTKI
jgi:site-specific recombinase XerD